MSEPTSPGPAQQPQGDPRSSGFEKADKAMQAAGKAARATSTVLATVYGLVLIAVGIGLAIVAGDAWWAGALIALYGVYLVIPSRFIPGRKFVIY
ncbi:MAG: hypothetical protein ACK5H2_09365 [Beutenbergiaceae bacterium]